MHTTIRNTDVKTFADILKNLSHRQHDLVIPSDSLEMTETADFRVRNTPLPDGLANTLSELGVAPADGNRADLPYKMMELAHGQLVSKLPIPAFKRAYDFMRSDSPAELAQLINHYLTKDDRNFMLRTFRPEKEDGSRGIIRAVLSDRYGIIDNFDIFIRAAKTIRGMGLTPNVRCSLTERNMWVEFTLPETRIRADELVGKYRNPFDNDGNQIGSRDVYAGFLLRNSEVGAGAFEIVPRLIVEICQNGMVRKNDALRKIHLGAETNSGVVQYSDDVRQKALELTDMQVRETVEHFCTEEYLYRAVEDVMGRGDAEKKLEHPVEAVRNARQHLGMSEDEEEDLLNYFVNGGDTRRVAVPAAVTAYAQTVDDADHAYDLEYNAWDVLDEMDRLDVAPERRN